MRTKANYTYSITGKRLHPRTILGMVPVLMTQNPKTAPSETRVISGRTILAGGVEITALVLERLVQRSTVQPDSLVSATVGSSSEFVDIATFG